jgi:hypothetical protein
MGSLATWDPGFRRLMDMASERKRGKRNPTSNLARECGRRPRVRGRMTPRSLAPRYRKRSSLRPCICLAYEPLFRCVYHYVYALKYGVGKPLHAWELQNLPTSARARQDDPAQFSTQIPKTILTAPVH